ncbi:hypothetical protein FPZ42_07690 [Mucilaginibacter achroorhodeus]|uniref:Uncharacterized protein n=1 Tax=Mucilaginibacter achroorhodeus TaxID=2599294 RepID=A0A563U6D9_9SPHI|nr:hypothetical protein [Mucilaginibacter achroorhodeus]TWR26908.1 hypothetical protein FPZ42_07690 [Mucilaginibacter achroorhodeus]
MITLIQQPQLFVPVQSPVIFQLQSDNSNILYFEVKVMTASEMLLANQRYQVFPNQPKKTSFDLSSILSNQTDYYLDVSLNLIEPATEILKDFKLIITEKVVSGNDIINGAAFETDVYYIWNGSLNNTQYNHYDYNNFVLQAFSGATNSLFLTDKPNYSKVHYHSTELLYVLNKDLPSFVLTLKLYDRNNHYIGNYGLTYSNYTTAFRINASPLALATYFNIDFKPVKYFTLQLLDVNGVQKTKLRFYQYEQLKCQDEPVILVHANAKGGYDSCYFINPKEAINVSKTTMTKSSFGFNDSGLYSNINNNIFNSEKRTITVNTESTFTVVSQPLNDVDSRYLKQLFMSPEVYVKLSDGTYQPISINNTSYEVGKVRLSNGLIRQTIQFTAPTGIDIVNYAPLNDDFLPPNIPYVEVDSYCYSDTDFPTFGYLEIDANGDANVEDGI